MPKLASYLYLAVLLAFPMIARADNVAHPSTPVLDRKEKRAEAEAGLARFSRMTMRHSSLRRLVARGDLCRALLGSKEPGGLSYDNRLARITRRVCRSAILTE